MPTLYRGIATRTPLRAASKKEVPVATYAGDRGSDTNQAQRTVLNVDISQPMAWAVTGQDAGRKAVAFDKRTAPKMTPTMRSFTLDGKVAVVTG